MRFRGSNLMLIQVIFNEGFKDFNLTMSLDCKLERYLKMKAN